ncbi:MAG: hypothetical protein L6N94_01130 [Candidatus Methylarchaceae archaeon HK01M]|nr:hypothetical protein [Candidatus Methylarchaceae archaeon HK01M]
MKRRIKFFILLISILSISLFLPFIANAAPSSKIDELDPNFITINTSQTEEINFTNSAGTTNLDDVASTIQYITLAATVENPSSASIELSANWAIYEPGTLPPDSNARTKGTVVGYKSENVIYAPYSLTTNVDIYTWNLGKPSGTLEGYTASSQFAADLKILRPHEYLILTITINCIGNEDSAIDFFFRGSEFAPTSVPITSIGTLSYDDNPEEDISDPEKTQRMNLFYQDTVVGNPSNPTRQIGWWPLHNSLDPYDAGINDGHAFKQSAPNDPLKSWTIDPLGGTQGGFSKTRKMVHQIPPVNGYGSIHLCGFKFRDLNTNGIFDVDAIIPEPKIDGVTITLLGADGETLAQDYYSGDFTLLGSNPVETGEGGLIGHYCFNLENVELGSYTFFIRETLPEGTIPTTPIIIGPIEINIDTSEQVTISGNIFGNIPLDPRDPVGGTLLPADLVQLTISWMNLGILISLITIGLAMAGKKKYSGST